MKSGSVYLWGAILSVTLCAYVFCVGGCGYVVKGGEYAVQTVADVVTMGSEPEAYAQLGETEAEGRRRHLRNQRINQQELLRDIDTILLLDRPSRLTDKRVP